MPRRPRPSLPSPSTASAPDPADTRTRLLDAAEALLHARGYRDLGVQDICTAAGVTKSSFYHFFAAKEALAAAVIDRRWAATQRAMAPLFALPRPPLATIRAFFDAVATQAEAMHRDGSALLGCPFGTLGSEMATTSPLIRTRAAAVFAELTARFRDLLEAAATAGDLPPATSPAALADSLVALMQGLSVLGRVNNDPAQLRRIAATTLAALLPPTPPAASA